MLLESSVELTQTEKNCLADFSDFICHDAWVF